jgi:hypothetical protein
MMMRLHGEGALESQQEPVIKVSDLMTALLDVHSNSIRRLSIHCQHEVRLARASET